MNRISAVSIFSAALVLVIGGCGTLNHDPETTSTQDVGSGFSILFEEYGEFLGGRKVDSAYARSLEAAVGHARPVLSEAAKIRIRNAQEERALEEKIAKLAARRLARPLPPSLEGSFYGWIARKGMRREIHGRSSLAVAYALLRHDEFWKLAR